MDDPNDSSICEYFFLKKKYVNCDKSNPCDSLKGDFENGSNKLYSERGYSKQAK